MKKMRAAAAVAEDTSLEYEFTADTGEVEPFGD